MGKAVWKETTPKESLYPWGGHSGQASGGQSFVVDDDDDDDEEARYRCTDLYGQGSRNTIVSLWAARVSGYYVRSSYKKFKLR